MKKIKDKLAFTLVIVILLDLITTFIGVSIGIKEANPLGLWWVVTASLIVSAVFLFKSFKDPIENKFIKFIMILPIVGRSIVIIYNLFIISLSI